MAIATRRGARADEGRTTGPPPALALAVRTWCARCQRPIQRVSRMPATATTAHQAMLRWPYGATRNAARRGPIADPALPPT